ITREDVLAAVAKRSAVQSTDDAAPKPAPASSAGVRRIPHDSMRRRIAEHMQRSLSSAPHVTAVFEADFSAVVAHRKAVQHEFDRQDIKLTYTAYLVLASVAAMKEVPVVNSRWHDEFLEVFDDVNIGVGTALGDSGLIVPVIHRAQELSLVQVAARLQDLTARARATKLKP